MENRMERMETEDRELVCFEKGEGNEAVSIVKDQSGIGVVELVLILVVLVGLVILFREQLSSIMASVFEKVNAAIGKM